jgi:hypothetical protein
VSQVGVNGGLQNHKVKKEGVKSPLSFKIGVETSKSQ